MKATKPLSPSINVVYLQVPTFLPGIGTAITTVESKPGIEISVLEYGLLFATTEKISGKKFLRVVPWANIKNFGFDVSSYEG